MKILNEAQKYNKAYVPVIVGVLLITLSHFGITGDMSVEDLLYFLVASIAVYFVPNKK